jgi:hypothetical protein
MSTPATDAISMTTAATGVLGTTSASSSQTIMLCTMPESSVRSSSPSSPSTTTSVRTRRIGGIVLRASRSVRVGHGGVQEGGYEGELYGEAGLLRSRSSRAGVDRSLK